MGKRWFSKRSNLICFSWTVVAILLLCAIFIAALRNDSVMQEVVGNIVKCYAFASCILAVYVAYMKKKEK